MQQVIALWTKEELEILQQELEQGKTYREIATKLGKSWDAVRNKARREKKNLERENREKVSTKQTKPSPKNLSNFEGLSKQVLESSTDSRIKSIYQLLQECDVDLDEWIVEKALVNKWEVGAKKEVKSIVFENGKIIEGFIESNGDLQIEPLFQVKVWLAPAKIQVPDLIIPSIVLSISYPTIIPRYPNEKSNSLKKGLILTDPQFGFRRLQNGKLNPFHSREALDVAYQIACEDNYDLVVWIGDHLDLAEWSDKFVRSPDMYFTTQAAISEGAWWIHSIPGKRRILLEGNHDYRLRLALYKRLPIAANLYPANDVDGYPMLSIPRLLGLQTGNIEYVENYEEDSSEFWVNDDLVIIHGSKAIWNPGYTVGRMAMKSQTNLIMGHIHRIETATATIRNRNIRKPVTAMCCGCLCRLDGSVPGSGKDANWQNGIGIIEYDDEKVYRMDTIPITNGEAYFKGMIFKASDKLPQIIKDTGLTNL